MTNESESSVWTPAFWGILAVAVALRLYHLAGHSLWYDEAVTIWGTNFVDAELSFLRSDESRLVPLLAITCFLWLNAIAALPGVVLGSDVGDFFVRLMPAIFSIAIVPATYRLALTIYSDRKVALLAAWLVAISPFHIYYAQEFRSHSLYALMVTVAMYNAYRALEEGQRRHWAGTIIFGALSFYAHYFAAFYLMSINLFALSCFTRYRHRIVPWTLSQIAIGVLLIPAGLMAIFTFGQFAGAEEYWFPEPTAKHLLLTLKALLAGYSPHLPVYYGLLGTGLIFMLVGAWAQWRASWTLRFLISMSFLPVLLQIVMWSFQEFAFFTYRIQLAYSATVFIWIALGMAQAKPKLATGIAVAFAALTAPAIVDVYQQDLHPSWQHRIGARYKPDSRSAARWVAERWQEGDYIAHTATNTLSPFRDNYFSAQPQSVAGFTDEERQGLLRSYPDQSAYSKLGFFPVRVEDIAAQGKRVWYVQSWWEPFEPIPLVYEYRAWFDANLKRVDQHTFDGVHVYLYEPRESTDGTRDSNPVLTNGVDTMYEEALPDIPVNVETGSEWMADTVPRLAGKRPVAAGTTADGAVIARNMTQEPIDVVYHAYESIATIPGIALKRGDGEDVWRPTTLYDGLYTISARLTGDARATLHATQELPAGAMSIFMRIVSDNSPQNTNWGAVTCQVSQGDRVLLESEIPANDPSRPNNGWQWVKAGTISSAGGETMLSFTAHNPDGLEAAYMDIERVVFVYSNAEMQLLEPEFSAISLEPAGHIEISGASEMPQIGNRVDWEFRDSNGQRYNLYRHGKDGEKQ